MNLSQSVAGGSRNVETARFFSSAPTKSGIPAGSSPSPHAWKFALNLRIWSEDGPKGAARKILTALLWSTDEYGRTWLAMRAIMAKADIGNERTVRKGLEVLAAEGWIEIAPGTWASLKATQLSLGQKAPRRGDAGQAPHTFTVLKSPSPTKKPEATTYPGLSRTAANPVEETPRQICRGPQEQICRGGPGANLPPDPYQSGSVSKKVREEREAPQTDTHNFSKAQKSTGDWDWLSAWSEVVEAHAEKTKAVYGVPAMRPDVKRDDRRAVAECLDGTATELAAKLRARGIDRELVHVRQDLAGRAMTHYFRNDTPYLRKTKHALRDLPREFQPRLIEAMQAILRESHEAANVPRRTAPLEAPAREEKAEKAAQLKTSNVTEKPLPVNAAREARRIVEALNVPSSGPELAKRTNVEPRATQATEPARSVTTEPQLVQRSLGRAGAPRWGALPPTPTKVRLVSRLQLSEPEEAPEDVELHLRE